MSRMISTSQPVAQKTPLRRQIWDARYLYLLLVPGILYFAIF